jgi:hypothetical protein
MQNLTGCGWGQKGWGAKYPKQASLKLTGDDFYKKIRQHDQRNRAH